tara:strand:+ start:356 stop:1033 length:678 start_codon:yes stop_codon:yes gene_type:complete
MIHSGVHEEIICELYPFMACYREFKPKNEARKKQHEDNKYFFKRGQDNLMYCIYCIVKNTLDIRDFTKGATNQALRTIAIENCKADNGSKLKPIKQSKKDFMNDVFTIEKIDWIHFYGMCVYHDIVIYVIKKNLLYIYGEYDDDDPKVDGIIIIDNNSTFFEFADKKRAVNRDEYYIISNPTKPLKSASFYKIADLQEICKKLNIDFLGLKKPVIYESIVNYMNE